MARRVFLHLGLPKTGTSYLQTILWAHREELADAELLVPGRERRDHLWASLVVRDDPRVARRNPKAPHSWQVLLAETSSWGGDALISHEFFGAASAEQAARVLSDLAPAEVHLVLTAREPLGLFTSSWQESLKNKGTVPIEDYGHGESDDPLEVWDWRALDLGLVLDRWAADLPPDRVHIVPVPGSGAPPDELWRSFCTVLGIAPGIVGDAGRFPNASMGVVEAETLRRLNARLVGFDAAFDRGVWIRSFLADERLVPRGGERFWPGPDQVEDCRRRGEAAVALIRERGYDVVGDLESLRVPDDLPERRHPSSVTDAEVADVALDLAARLLSDLKDGVRPGAGQGMGGQADTRSTISRWVDRLRRRR
ncbi:hypothetical protein [Nocardioides sp.]|uniref:hypothetical protein n=1 Tax=Nocardioides sp. TaxID=35761 RepID=UPI001A32776B|nr:hypothetical protein [Nocardioides sp.]MBJ7358172.1 hypothetical protein [Nocardioides sp.]